MKMCPDHWERLRQAIKDRGLWHLVATGGEQAARNLKAELEDGPSIQTFDPLMAAHNAIAANAIGSPVGLELMFGDHCPICLPRDRHTEQCSGPPCPLTPASFEAWIDLAADGAASVAAELLAKASPDA